MADVDEVIKQTLKNPVCGMTVTENSSHVFNYKDKPIYFCSAGCKTKFAANPVQYSADDAIVKTAILEKTSNPPEAIATGIMYTCPMHPEIRQDHAGACPKCGMALKPEMPSLEKGGRTDLAGDPLLLVKAPTLLIVGGEDHDVIRLKETALAQIRGEKRLDIIQGAIHLFEESGTLEQVASLARQWFKRYLISAVTHPSPANFAKRNI